MYDVIPDRVASTSALLNEPLNPLKERLADCEDPIEAVETDVRIYSLFVKDFSKSDALKLPHKSFFEYIFSTYVARRVTGKDVAICNAIRVATNVSDENIIDMPESLSFAGELLSSNQEHDITRVDLLDELFNRVVLPQQMNLPRFLKRILLWEVVSHTSKNLFLRLFTAPIFVFQILIQIIAFYIVYSHWDIPTPNLSASLWSFLAFPLMLSFFIINYTEVSA